MYKDAIKCFDLAIKADPNDLAASNNKENVLEDIKRDLNAFVYQGNNLCRAMQYQEGINCYKKAIELDPNNEIAKHNLAVIDRINSTNSLSQLTFFGLFDKSKIHDSFISNLR